MNTHVVTHTPGLWTAKRLKVDLIEITGPQYPVAHIEHDTRDTAQMDANARLIAAAPKLLIALEACVELLELAMNAEENPFGVRWNDATDASDQARAALALAQGKNS